MDRLFIQLKTSFAFGLALNDRNLPACIGVPDVIFRAMAIVNDQKMSCRALRRLEEIPAPFLEVIPVVGCCPTVIVRLLFWTRAA